MPRKQVMSDNKEVLAALGRLDQKFEDQGKTLSQVAIDMSAFKEWQRAQTQQAERWWSQTWPQHTDVVKGIEERVRAVEQQKVTLERMDKLERSTSERINQVEGQLKAEVDGCVKRLEGSFSEALHRIEQSALDRVASAEKSGQQRLNQVSEMIASMVLTDKAHADEIKMLKESNIKTNVINHIITFAASTAATVVIGAVIHHFFFGH